MPKTKKPIDSQEIKSKVVEHALKLAAQLGWEHTRLSDIADSAGLSLADVQGHFDCKTDILVAFGRMIDHKVLQNMGKADLSMTPRDRLFDILMERFDVLNDHRPGLISILESFRYDPKQAVISLPYLCNSMTWMLEAAGEETHGFRGALKVAGLSGVYLKVLKTWKDDDSADLSKTMAALDKDLGRVEQFAAMLNL